MRREILRGTTAPATLSPEARTIDVMWYSGSAVRRYDFWRDEEYMLSFSMEKGAVRLDRLKTGAPVLNAHNDMSLETQIGVVEKAWIEGGKGFATLRFSEREAVQSIWSDIRDGIVQNVSMGAMVYQRRDITEKGDKVKHILAIDWEPTEISAVPVGADPHAGFLAFDSRDEYKIAEAHWRKHHQSSQSEHTRLQIALAAARFNALR